MVVVWCRHTADSRRRPATRPRHPRGRQERPQQRRSKARPGFIPLAPTPAKDRLSKDSERAPERPSQGPCSLVLRVRVLRAFACPGSSGREDPPVKAIGEDEEHGLLALLDSVLDPVQQYSPGRELTAAWALVVAFFPPNRDSCMCCVLAETRGRVMHELTVASALNQ